MEIARASGRRTPQQMREIFGLAEDKGSTMFTHLENLLEEINHTQNTVNELKEENRNLLKSISTSERKLKWEISEKQAKMGLCKTEAERAEVYMNSERTELNNLYESLWRIHKMCGLGDTEFEDGINDFNAETIKEEVEKQIIEYLMQIEYFRMKKALIEKKSQVPLQKEVIDPHSPTLGKDTEETEVLDTLQPRTLESEAELSSLNYLQQTESVLPLERLKQTAMAAVAEMESTEDSEEDDESK
nr:uncharacterized protein LOC107454595 [Parasteatoda tepidariorum]